VPKKEPWKTKQMVLIVLTASLLWVPAMVYISYYLDHGIKPSSLVGAINLVAGTSILALVSEKWIRKIKCRAAPDSC
jgi:membrane protein DedA with SNARE-associated domain